MRTSMLLGAATALALSVVGPAAAAAETPKEMIALFARTDVAKVSAAHGVRIEGAYVTELVVGTYHKGDYDHHIAVLLRCGEKTCNGETVSLGNAPFEVHGLVDLGGAPGPLIPSDRLYLRDRGDNWNASLSARGQRWPALVITTRDEKVTTGGSRFRGEVTGSETHEQVYVLSLRKAERDAPRVALLNTLDRYPSGAGSGTTFRLVRGKQKGALDIQGTEQRYIEDDSACMRPEPVEHLWRFKDGRYQQFDNLLARGCH